MLWFPVSDTISEDIFDLLLSHEALFANDHECAFTSVSAIGLHSFNVNLLYCIVNSL
ncbi:MAG: hypothetical protein ACOYMB_04950 [Patescibacteria group bacterium]